MFFYVAKCQASKIDRTFSALADPTRRAVLLRLKETPGLSVSELARPLSLKLPGMMKHLDVLSDAGLITRTKAGRTVSVRLSAAPMRDAMAWLKRYERFWTASIDRLAAARKRGQQVIARNLPSVTVVRKVKAPPAKVYAALTELELVIRWWGPDAGPTLSAEADVRPGSRSVSSIAVRSPTSSFPPRSVGARDFSNAR